MSTVSSSNEKASLPAVVIIGGGFGRLCAAKALANAPVRVVLIDRSNHHLFQPLLYQVATAAFTALCLGLRSLRSPHESH